MKSLLKPIKQTVLHQLTTIDPELLEPEVLLRPSQFFKVLTAPKSRVEVELGSQFRSVRLPWKVDIQVRPDEFVGAFICKRGLYDIDVCETIARLLDTGESAIDVGANIGQMVSLMAVKAGPTGSVIAFEPHPEVYQDLAMNVRQWCANDRLAPVELHSVALSDRSGTDFLRVPKCFAENRGVAAIDAIGDGREAADVDLIEIQKATLTEKLSSQKSIGVMKMDVEGHELSVLQGASDWLAQGKIRDIIFEERFNDPTPVTEYLEQFGYTIFHLSHKLSGMDVQPLSGKTLTIDYFINCLATLEPERALDRLRSQGWQTIGVPSQVGKLLSKASRSAGAVRF